MKTTLNDGELSFYVARQINNLFPDSNNVSSDEIDHYMNDTMDKVSFCFNNIRRKYFYDNNETLFNHLHSDHYSMFLYILSNVMYRKDNNENLSTKVFLLNKALNSIDAFYSIQLPDVFLFVHPVGTVLGNAKYGNYFAVYQNCAIGSDEDGIYPEFGEGVVLYARSSVIGNCKIGNNVVIGANTFILNMDIPDDSVVTGSYPNVKILKNNKSVLDRKFNL